MKMTNAKDKANKEEYREAAENMGRSDRLDESSTDDSEVPTSQSIDCGDEDTDTCSSFSLQECINEFRARRIRRISTQSRDCPVEKNANDDDLVEQNRTNKEQERKCKPCKNGFCYCFTSDSGDGGCSVNGAMPAAVAATRAAYMRRSRKQEIIQLPKHTVKPKDYRRRSAPATCKASQYEGEHVKSTSNCARPEKNIRSNTMQLPVTAISRLETSSKDAPLIHIIQELHSNCVISEVRVNKHKIEAQQRQQSFLTQTVHTKCGSMKKQDVHSHRHKHKQNCSKSVKNSTAAVNVVNDNYQQPKPSAPHLDTISEMDSAIEADRAVNTSLEMCKVEAQQHRHKYGGRLLQKRLSYSDVQYKPPDMSKPPRKPPRCSQHYDRKNSDASTNPSLRKAKQIIDEFLLERGVALPTKDTIQMPMQQRDIEKKAAAQRDKRKSYPLTESATTKKNKNKTMRTYPSLSDFEHSAEHKKLSNYNKNISNKVAEKPIKELTLGWASPKITEMLNYDTNVNRREFKSQAVQAEPQSIGWQIPPKISLDTVDGHVQQNLATNIEYKETPVKSPQISPQKSLSSSSTKFIWGEQWRNLSPFISTKEKKPKSNLKSTSNSFLNSSKKKILRLVTPKKDNKQPGQFVARKTPLRSIGIQTSREDLQLLQSPPGSYHSTVQNSSSRPSSEPSTPSSNNNQSQSADADTLRPHFDFNRTVHSPPKKNPIHSQRKLNFPLNCADGMCVSRNNSNVEEAEANLTKTYRSYNAELDQDLTLSKMNCILGNIRARLEASDEHAMRTFQEVERREQEEGNGVDYTDSAPTCSTGKIKPRLKYQQHDIEPLYSEIEEDSIHISDSPQYDNKSGTKHYFAATDPSALYAKVNKPPKQQKAEVTTITTTTRVTTRQTPLALGAFLHDSLKNRQKLATASYMPNHGAPSAVVLSDATNSTSPRRHPIYFSSKNTSVSPTPTPIPTPAPTESVTQTEIQTESETPTISNCDSLNNVRVMEQHSPPKKNRNLSKSDLSLHRSEIFLENLCRSELIIDAGNNAISQTSLQKIDNHRWNDSYASIQNANEHFEQTSAATDTVSYELPAHDSDINAITAGSQLAVNTIAPLHKNNQSTPKKSEIFTTKSEMNSSMPTILHINTNSFIEYLNASNSCPVTPSNVSQEHNNNKHEKQQSCSLNEMSNSQQNNHSSSNLFNHSTVARYKRLKNVLRKSFRKSKNFVKTETKRLSQSLSIPSTITSPTKEQMDNQNQSDAPLYAAASSLYLERLFAAEMQMPIKQQLAQAVSFCRQMPNLEISTEMVEAERLLLFSTLRDSKLKEQQQQLQRQTKSLVLRRYYIDAMRLPIKADASQDIFFNYFYIVTFECGGVIRSTQSVECQNGEAIFRDCGIEFDSSCELETDDAEIRCEIFMLRLRKVSTLTLEPPKRIKLSTPSTATSSAGSTSDIVSRFRLHAYFTLKATDFTPYEYVECISRNTDKLCLRASSSYCVPITRRTKSTNLANEMQLTARAEVRLPKLKHQGFLNVEEPHTQHNWNRRWCTLDGIHVRVWQDNQAESPLLCLDLRQSLQTMPLEMAPRELCARPRAFCLQCHVGKMLTDLDDELLIDAAAVFFAADTVQDLTDWLKSLNDALYFISTWMQ